MSFKLFLIFLLLSLMLSGASFAGTTYASLPWQSGRIHVDIYIIALDGVEAREIGNVTRVLDGARKAVERLNENNFTVMLPFLRYWKNVSSYFFAKGSGSPPYEDMVYVHAGFPVNASFHVITEWGDYISMVELSVECVVVNAHGAVVPVPSGYTKEAWIDKIAEAMLYRNLTWVHVGGYPFFYYWHEQESSVEVWGEKGFQQLMKHIEKPNITCPKSDWNVDTGTSEYRNNLYPTWATSCAEEASRDWPLNASDFEKLTTLKIWGEYDYYTGAVIAFKKLENQTNFGFYIHIGTNQTFDLNGYLVDRDYWRSHIACAAGLWALISRTASETIFFEVQTLIDKAVNEGRTHGLDEAYKYLNEAKYFNHHYYGPIEFWDRIYQSMVAAVKAEKTPPSSIEQKAAIIIAAVVCVAGIGTGITWRKRNSKKEREETD